MEAFANSNIKVRDMKASILDAGNSGIEPSYSKDTDSLVDVYNIAGPEDKNRRESAPGHRLASHALYIIGGRKVLLSE